MMQCVNDLVRSGLSYREISTVVGRSPRTVQRYHLGIADNCLEWSQHCHGRDSRTVMYLGSSVDI